MGVNMKITMLGTGNASVTNCYNSCFLITEKDESILVDGGGGSQIFSQLKKAGHNWKDVKNIIVTHKHMDHIIGIFWLVRMICQHINRNEYNGNVKIYSHDEVIYLIKDFMHKFLEEKDVELVNERLFLIEVHDGQKISIAGINFTFFDILSSKTKQYAFLMDYDFDKKLVCCGDEPYNPLNKKYVENVDWLIHESFCLYSDEQHFKAYEKNHSTVKDACINADKLNVKNLILFHTEDENIRNRKELYSREGKKYYSGNLIIPNDLEVIFL